uniref:hypothetical protein n=1 Tax=Komagataeibacter europaeus TaxID=33995 RepID=UPI0012DDE07D|nr:hypothetical protein [Komagataeibacter europaeus]
MNNTPLLQLSGRACRHGMKPADMREDPVDKTAPDEMAANKPAPNKKRPGNMPGLSG